MSQKSTPNSKILSQLKEKVKKEEKEKDYWFNRFQKADDEIKNKENTIKALQHIEDGKVSFRQQMINREIESLQEIIRLLIQAQSPHKPKDNLPDNLPRHMVGSNY